MMTKPTAWLNDAIIYEIYPQSFVDSNGDGIGDLPGAITKLDYLQWLGINTIWFNPCFESPFIDAGYDVADYLNIAPRYGTNEDMVKFVEEAAKRGIRVLLDLVVGHTSTDHQWFQAEIHEAPSAEFGDRYIWAVEPRLDNVEADVLKTTPWVASPGSRREHYLKNFFEAQPALNFGYARMHPEEPWRQSIDAPGPMRNRAALKEILAFWLDRGVAGFRVDMAFSLVKDDEGQIETMKLWRELRRWLDENYPSAVIIPEGVDGSDADKQAFHGDFFLVIGGEHLSLFNNGGAGKLPWAPEPNPYFGQGGTGSIKTFVENWNHVRERSPQRPVIVATADHDFARLASGDRTPEQLGVAFTFLLTWGSVPSIYYGDEIGMRFQPDMPNKEGAVCFPGFYNRAGVRTPMHWDTTANAGFSTASADEIYLPIDPDTDRVNVEQQLSDPHSTLHLLRELIAIRNTNPALGTHTQAEILHADYPLIYLREDSHLIALNPSGQRRVASISGYENAEPLINHGVEISSDEIAIAPFGFGIFRLSIR